MPFNFDNPVDIFNVPDSSNVVQAMAIAAQSSGNMLYTSVIDRPLSMTLIHEHTITTPAINSDGCYVFPFINTTGFTRAIFDMHNEDTVLLQLSARVVYRSGGNKVCDLFRLNTELTVGSNATLICETHGAEYTSVEILSNSEKINVYVGRI